MNILKRFCCGLVIAAAAAVPGSGVAQDDSNTVVLSGPEALTEVLIPATLEAYARDRGLTLRREITGNGALALVLRDPNDQIPDTRFEMRTSDAADTTQVFENGTVDLALSVGPARATLPAAESGGTILTLGRTPLFLLSPATTR